MVKLHFLPAQNLGHTKRDRELASAAARSVAASLAHRRRKAEFGEKFPQQPRRKRHNRRSLPPPIVKDSATVEADKCVSPSLNNISGQGSLDPFFRLAVPLSKEQKAFVHHCKLVLRRTFLMLIYFTDLTFVPNHIYGLRDRPAFCPVRDCSIPEFATNTPFLLLVVFLAARSLQADNVTILTCRAAAYTSVRLLMQDSRRWQLDSTIFSLAVTAIAEYRCGSLLAVQKHMSACMNLLAIRGGLKIVQSMALSKGMGVINAIVMLGFSPFLTRDDLAAAMTTHTEELTACLWSQPRHSHILSSSLRQYFTSDTRGEPRAHMVNLHIITFIMIAGDPSWLLSNLEAKIQNSQGTGKLLSPTPIMYTICSCAESVGHWNDSDTSQLKTWRALEFATMMDLAPRSTQWVMESLVRKLQEPGATFEATEHMTAMEALKAEMLNNLGLLPSKEQSLFARHPTPG